MHADVTLLQGSTYWILGRRAAHPIGTTFWQFIQFLSDDDTVFPGVSCTRLSLAGLGFMGKALFLLRALFPFSGHMSKIYVLETDFVLNFSFGMIFLMNSKPFREA